MAEIEDDLRMKYRITIFFWGLVLHGKQGKEAGQHNVMSYVMCLAQLAVLE
jgi:hypothetical protein